MGENTKKEIVRISSWEQVTLEELKLLHQIFDVKNSKAVEAAVSFARYVRGRGLDSENYHFFLRLLDIDNHWVADALIEDDDVFEFFAPIPPNTYLLGKVFQMLSRWAPSGVYPKTLGVLLGVLIKAYKDPRDGYKIYPVSIPDLDNLAKHLDPDGGQTDVFNQHLLGIIDYICRLKGIERNSPMEVVARQAEKIKGTFFDNRKTMDSAIPLSLTIRGNYNEGEVRPRKLYVN